MHGADSLFTKNYSQDLNKDVDLTFINHFNHGVRNGLYQMIESGQLVFQGSYKNGIKQGEECEMTMAGDTVYCMSYTYYPGAEKPGLMKNQGEHLINYTFKGKIEVSGSYWNHGHPDLLYDLVSFSKHCDHKGIYWVETMNGSWICFFDASGMIYQYKLN